MPYVTETIIQHLVNVKSILSCPVNREHCFAYTLPILRTIKALGSGWFDVYLDQNAIVTCRCWQSQIHFMSA